MRQGSNADVRQENETVRKHFISDVLEIPLSNIRSVRVINSFLWKRYKKQKQGILDVQLELNNDTKINVEVQLRHKKNWRKRSVFYLAKMFTADLRRGEDYEKAKKCIVIAILGFDINESEKDWVNDSPGYHNVYMMRDNSGHVYTDVLELHTIELNKKPNKPQPTPLDEWHTLFNAETEEDLNMIKSRTKNNGIIEAIKELREINLSDRMRYEYELRLKAKRDRKAEDDYVREEEREKNIRIFVSALRKHRFTDEQIMAELMEEYKLNKKEAEEKLQKR